MSDDFNLDTVMKESSERYESAVEELATKDELKQEDFSSDAKELHDKGESILKDHNACGCAAESEPQTIDNSIRGRLRNKAKEYYRAKHELEKHQANLWLSTDFKAEGCTNAEMRKAFIASESEEETKAYYDAKLAYADVKREWELEITHLKKKEILVL